MEKLPIFRRIRSRVEFEKALCADRLTNKWFVAYIRKSEHCIARLGLIVSKKTMPKAVSRNFAKRLIREVFRRNFPAERSIDIVVRPRRQINPQNSAEGRLALTQLLQTIQG